MPKYNHPNLGDVVRHVFLVGTIEDVKTEDDTATVAGGRFESTADIPLFYHCPGATEQRENGAINGASSAFVKDDEVIVMCRVDGPDTFTPVRIVGFTSGPKPCCELLCCNFGDGPDTIPLIEWTEPGNIIGAHNQGLSSGSWWVGTGVTSPTSCDYTYDPPALADSTGLWTFSVLAIGGTGVGVPVFGGEIGEGTVYLAGAAGYVIERMGRATFQKTDAFKQQLLNAEQWFLSATFTISNLRVDGYHAVSETDTKFGTNAYIRFNALLNEGDYGSPIKRLRMVMQFLSVSEDGPSFPNVGSKIIVAMDATEAIRAAANDESQVVTIDATIGLDGNCYNYQASPNHPFVSGENSSGLDLILDRIYISQAIPEIEGVPIIMAPDEANGLFTPQY